MANEEHLKILKQGVEQWNKWREENVVQPHWSADGKSIFVLLEDDGVQTLLCIPVSGGAPSGAFLHAIRRASTEDGFFSICREHLDHGNPMPLEPFAKVMEPAIAA